MALLIFAIGTRCTLHDDLNISIAQDDERVLLREIVVIHGVVESALLAVSPELFWAVAFSFRP